MLMLRLFAFLSLQCFIWISLGLFTIHEAPLKFWNVRFYLLKSQSHVESLSLFGELKGLTMKHLMKTSAERIKHCHHVPPGKVIKATFEFGHHWLISYSFYFIFLSFFLSLQRQPFRTSLQQNEEKRMNIRWVIEENLIFKTWLLWNTQVWIWIELDTLPHEV